MRLFLKSSGIVRSPMSVTVHGAPFAVHVRTKSSSNLSVRLFEEKYSVPPLLSRLRHKAVRACQSRLMSSTPFIFFELERVEDNDIPALVRVLQKGEHIAFNKRVALFVGKAVKHKVVVRPIQIRRR